jgi:hypothetical protein
VSEARRSGPVRRMCSVCNRRKQQSLRRRDVFMISRVTNQPKSRSLDVSSEFKSSNQNGRYSYACYRYLAHIAHRIRLIYARYTSTSFTSKLFSRWKPLINAPWTLRPRHRPRLSISSITMPMPPTAGSDNDIDIGKVIFKEDKYSCRNVDGTMVSWGSHGKIATTPNFVSVCVVLRRSPLPHAETLCQLQNFDGARFQHRGRIA